MDLLELEARHRIIKDEIGMVPNKMHRHKTKTHQHIQDALQEYDWYRYPELEAINLYYKEGRIG